MPAKPQSERVARIKRLWRGRGLPRLYWRFAHPKWRSWDREDVAMWKDGSASMHFHSIVAIEEFLIEHNIGEK